MADKQTGLGVDALYGETAAEQLEPSEAETPPAPKEQPAAQRKKTRKGARSTPKPKVDSKVEEAQEKQPPLPRRTAWLREDHLDRLQTLKLREKNRLRDDPNKRLAVTTLIDEAIEKYLAEME